MIVVDSFFVKCGIDREILKNYLHVLFLVFGWIQRIVSFVFSESL